MKKPPEGFQGLEVSPATHLQLWFHVAVLYVGKHVLAIGGPDTWQERFPFLQSYLEAAQAYLPSVTLNDLSDSWRDAVRGWESGLPPEADAWPLSRLTATGLGEWHLFALMLAGLVETDARFGLIYSALQPFPDESRLTVGLLDDLLQSSNVPAGLNAWKLTRELSEAGLLIAMHQTRARASWSLRIPSPVWNALQGERPAQPVKEMHHHQVASLSEMQALAEIFPADLAAQLARVPDLLLAGAIGGLVLRGMRGSGRLRALGSIAKNLGSGLLVLRRPDLSALNDICTLLGPLATLLGALPVIDLELGPGETVTLPPLPGYRGPLGIVLGKEGTVQGGQVKTCLTLSVPPTGIDARRVSWAQMLGDAQNGNRQMIERVSAQFQMTLGGIEQAAPLAQAYAALDGRAHLQASDVQQASRALGRQSLEALAARIDVGGAWEDLVVSEETGAEMMNLAMRCHQREAVLSHVGRGFRNSINRGVRALFSGPSGTGKTLAARILTAELGLDVYRVDLAAVVNKYIGETERNLSRLFARAEELDVILLIDEGDALLTSRTDVRSANDRYANLETNYLLQRLEGYEGILLITTNAVSRIDGAFKRRMDVHVLFNLPDPAQRYRIWLLHLPPEHKVGEAFLNTVAMRCEFSGGQIRNAALHATVLAVENETMLDEALLAQAIEREYRTLGVLSPLRQEVPDR